MRFLNRIVSFFTVLILATLSLGVSASAQEKETQVAKNQPKSEKVIVEKTNDETPGSNTEAKKAKKVAVTPPVRPVTERIGVNPGQTKSMSLNDAIRLALQNNNDIEVAREDVRIAESTLRSQLGFYDPTVTISPNYSNNVQPQPSIFSGADASGVVSRSTFSANSSFQQFIKQGGGNYNVFFNNSRTKSSSLASTLNPNFTSSLGVSFTQPLYKNRKIDQNRRFIKIQRKIIAQSDADFRRSTIEVVAQVQRAYWDLVFALRDQQNRVANLNLTKENLRQVEARIAAGAAAPLQKAEVNTELANRESDVLLASQQVSNHRKHV